MIHHLRHPGLVPGSICPRGRTQVVSRTSTYPGHGCRNNSGITEVRIDPTDRVLTITLYRPLVNTLSLPGLGR